MPVPYQNNMYPQMPYGQQQYGVNSYIPYMQPRFQQPEVPVQQVQQQTPQVQQMPILLQFTCQTGLKGHFCAVWWHTNSAIVSAFLSTYICQWNRRNIWQTG